MAGYAAGFSGLESFSPSSFSRSGLSLSIPSLVRAVFLSLAFSLSPSFIVSFNGAGKAGEETGSEEESKMHRETERETSRFAVLRGAGNVRPRRDPFNIADAALLARNEACRESQGETRAIAIVSPARFTRFTRSLSNGPMLIIVAASAK